MVLAYGPFRLTVMQPGVSLAGAKGRSLPIRGAVLKALNSLREISPSLNYSNRFVSQQILDEARHFFQLSAALQPLPDYKKPSSAADLLARPSRNASALRSKVPMPLLDRPDHVTETGRHLFGVEVKDAQTAVRDLIRSGDPWLVACAMATAAELRMRGLTGEISRAAGKPARRRLKRRMPLSPPSLKSAWRSST
ncbi:MAG: hypothetical protein M3Z23_11430 [Acidobacteriota bacterium]|nr:hypothetical protein [Acidobacteriota bacterium]